MKKSMIPAVLIFLSGAISADWLKVTAKGGLKIRETAKTGKVLHVVTYGEFVYVNKGEAGESEEIGGKSGTWRSVDILVPKESGGEKRLSGFAFDGFLEEETLAEIPEELQGVYASSPKAEDMTAGNGDYLKVQKDFVCIQAAGYAACSVVCETVSMQAKSGGYEFKCSKRPPYSPADKESGMEGTETDFREKKINLKAVKGGIQYNGRKYHSE